MVIGTLIGIQAVCVGVVTYLSLKTSKKATKLKLVNKEGKFKHYRTGGF